MSKIVEIDLDALMNAPVLQPVSEDATTPGGRPVRRISRQSITQMKSLTNIKGATLAFKDLVYSVPVRGDKVDGKTTFIDKVIIKSISGWSRLCIVNK